MDDARLIQSQALDWLRFPLAVLVIFIHTHSPLVGYAESTGDAVPLQFYMLLRPLARFAFPTFFIISGYFFAKGCGKQGLRYDAFFASKLRRRVRTLLVPFLLWNTLFALIVVARKWLAHDFTGLPSLAGIYWGNTAGWLDERNYLGLPYKLGVYPIDVPLWFVRDLMICCLLAPVLSWLALRLKRYYLVLIGAVMILGLTPVIAGYRSYTLLLFGLGLYFGVRGQVMTTAMERIKWPCLAIVLLLWYPDVKQESLPAYLAQWCDITLLLAGCITMINLAVLVTRKGWQMPALLRQSVFFVFAFHSLMLWGIPQLIRVPLRLMPHTFAVQALYVVVMPLIIAGLSVAAFAIARRVMPRLVALFTGGRC